MNVEDLMQILAIVLLTWTPNHPKPFDKKLPPTDYVCYPKHWTDGIGKFMCDLEHQDQKILRNEKELIWRCIPFEFWCRNINSYNKYMDFIAMFLCLGIILLAGNLMCKGIELLVNYFAPQPAIGPILPQFLPKPAPAA